VIARWSCAWLSAPMPLSSKIRKPATAEAADGSTTNLNDVSDRDWAEARRRRDLIAPLLDGTRCPRSIVVERARR
jgi:hypothetical protein